MIRWDQLRTQAPTVPLQIHLETWSSRWERPSAKESIWHYNSMTSPFFRLFFWVALQSAPFLYISSLSYFAPLMRSWMLAINSGLLSQSDVQTFLFCGRPQPFFSLLFSHSPKLLIHHTQYLNWMTSLEAAFNHFYFTAVMAGWCSLYMGPQHISHTVLCSFWTL